MHRLVAIVGIDGSGKTTLAKTLVAQLRSEGRRVRSFENAGGRPPLNWLARRLGHDDAQKWLGTTRLEAIEQRFRHVPMRLAATWARLPGERIAILDRWTVCQYAAMRARGSEDASARRRYRRLPWPDHVLFLDVSPEQAHARLRQRGQGRRRTRLAPRGIRGLSIAPRMGRADRDRWRRLTCRRRRACARLHRNLISPYAVHPPPSKGERTGQVPASWATTGANASRDSEPMTT